jgi:hypothetical protein
MPVASMRAPQNSRTAAQNAAAGGGRVPGLPGRFRDCLRAATPI